jgi:hypothetical protein
MNIYFIAGAVVKSLMGLSAAILDREAGMLTAATH